ncbi:hypothetical protein B0H14DRAFT_3173271 [Mycena olivaceomarginata]|nr:hypothetical protein B0H14DRAFT_3173271 [Mycena olivaceomarginata]
MSSGFDLSGAGFEGGSPQVNVFHGDVTFVQYFDSSSTRRSAPSSTPFDVQNSSVSYYHRDSRASTPTDRFGNDRTCTACPGRVQPSHDVLGRHVGLLSVEDCNNSNSSSGVSTPIGLIHGQTSSEQGRRMRRYDPWAYTPVPPVQNSRSSHPFHNIASNSASPRRVRVATAAPTIEQSDVTSSAAPSTVAAKAARCECRLGTCVICLDDETNIALIACGIFSHLALCKICSDSVMSSSRQCPVCRTPIAIEGGLLHIFKV